MGQYWYPVNLDKKEFIDPHRLGSGLKLWEQLANSPGSGSALIILCAAMPVRRGGGDFYTTHVGDERVVGRWAGDRIALVGDYAKDSDLPQEFKASGIVNECGDGGSYRDVSELVCSVIEQEIRGKFEGDGWRSFKRIDDEDKVV